MVGIVSSLFGEIPNNYVVCSRTVSRVRPYGVLALGYMIAMVRYVAHPISGYSSRPCFPTIAGHNIRDIRT